jgi:hypothetical protein
MSYRVGLAQLCFLLALAVFIGCGGKTSPVNGRVKLKDGGDVSALMGYTVSFETEADRVSGSGDIGKDGTFKITTFSPDDGAVPGKHRVAISAPDPPPDAPPPKPIIAQKYRDFNTSGLTADIKPGANNIEFELDRAP